MPNEPPLDSRCLLTEGDSWLALTGGTPDRPNDLEEMLEGQYSCEIASLASKGDTMEKIASSKQLTKLSEELKAINEEGRIIDAVLLSGGGNDLRKTLPNMLRDFNVGEATGWLESPCVDRFVGLLEGRYLAVLKHIDGELVRWALKSQIPVLVHGYAYPVPDGTGREDVAQKLGFAGPWLWPTFDAKGYCAGDKIPCLQRNTEIVADIIDRLNEMVLGLTGTQWKNIMVRYVDFRKCLVQRSNLRQYVADREHGYKVHWTDELHLNSVGLGLVVPTLVHALDNALRISSRQTGT